MNRRTFLAGSAATAIASQFARPQATRRRNILLIIADDQGPDLGCYGNTAIKTPNIDQLAANGVRFTHGFSAVSSCSPSRSVIQTGLYNHTNGQYGLAHALHNQATLQLRAVRTRRYKYILNLAWQLPYPIAADVGSSPSWKAIVERKPRKMGEVTFKTYMERPLEELFDLEKDPHELHNVAADPAYAATLKELRAKAQEFQKRTRDPWFINEYTEQVQHAH